MVRTLAASPPAVRAVLWMDAAVLLGVAFAFARTPALAQAGTWTWVALIGSTLTAVLKATAEPFAKLPLEAEPSAFPLEQRRLAP